MKIPSARRETMPFKITGAAANIPDGTYKATLEAVDEGESSYGVYRKWHWLVDVNGTLEPLSVITSSNTGPQSKSYQWLKALLGRELKAGEEVEDPIGKMAVLQIAKNAKGFPTVLSVLPDVQPATVEAGIPR
jgi:hypothetical protein